MPIKYNLTNDILFRIVFGAEKNKKILLSLVNAVMASKNLPELLEIRSVNPNLEPVSLSQKKPVLDIRALDNNGKQYDIEMQVKKEPDYINRSIFYLAKLYSEQLEPGEPYKKSKACVGIHFLDFILFPDSQLFHNMAYFRFGDEPYNKLSQSLSLHYIEMPKLNLAMLDISEKGYQNLEKWVYFIMNCNDKEDAMIDKLRSDIPEINLASEELDRLVDSYRARRETEIKERWESELHFAASRGFNEGIEEGRTEGEEKAKRELAKKLKADGFSDEKILELTGVSPKNIP